MEHVFADINKGNDVFRTLPTISDGTFLVKWYLKGIKIRGY